MFWKSDVIIWNYYIILFNILKKSDAIILLDCIIYQISDVIIWNYWSSFFNILKKKYAQPSPVWPGQAQSGLAQIASFFQREIVLQMCLKEPQTSSFGFVLYLVCYKKVWCYENWVGRHASFPLRRSVKILSSLYFISKRNVASLFLSNRKGKTKYWLLWNTSRSEKWVKKK